MKLAEWHEQLATRPLTLGQLGAVHGEFRRLGFRPADRRERLEITAGLAQIPDGLESTRDLTMGEAGRVVGALRSCRNDGELAALLDAQPGSVPALSPASMRSGPSLGEAIVTVVACLIAAWHPPAVATETSERKADAGVQ
jgi:hypothetical protein